MLAVEEERELTRSYEVEGTLNKNSKKRFYVSRNLRNKLKTNDFSHFIAKAKFHIIFWGQENIKLYFQ